jgi:hypothetical protein
MNNENCELVIGILGDAKVKEVFDEIGSEHVNFSKLYKIIRNQELEKAVKKGGCCFSKTADEFNVSRMTAYRKFRKK